MDFRAGLIAQGREAYEAALLDPDGLAGLPVVLAEARAGGDEEAFWRASALRASTCPDDVGTALVGEGFDVDDDAEMYRRLPCLAALFLGASEG